MDDKERKETQKMVDRFWMFFESGDLEQCEDMYKEYLGSQDAAGLYVLSTVSLALEKNDSMEALDRYMGFYMEQGIWYYSAAIKNTSALIYECIRHLIVCKRFVSLPEYYRLRNNICIQMEWDFFEWGIDNTTIGKRVFKFLRQYIENLQDGEMAKLYIQYIFHASKHAVAYGFPEELLSAMENLSSDMANISTRHLLTDTEQLQTINDALDGLISGLKDNNKALLELANRDGYEKSGLVFGEDRQFETLMIELLDGLSDFSEKPMGGEDIERRVSEILSLHLSSLFVEVHAQSALMRRPCRKEKGLRTRITASG